MKLIYNSSSMVPPLTGVGRYSVRIASTLMRAPDVEEVLFFVGPRVRGGLTPEDFTPAGAGAGAAAPPPGPLWKRALRRVPGAIPLARALLHARLRVAEGPAVGALYHETNFVLLPHRGPAVTTIHDLSWLHHRAFHPADRIRYFDRHMADTLRRADQVLTPSEFVRAELIGTAGVDPARVTAIPLGVDSAFRPRHARTCAGVLDRHGLPDRGYLLMVGSLEPRKNLSTVLDAWERLPAPVRAVHPLVHAGPPGWRNEALLARFERLARQGGLRRLGYVGEDDLACLYARAAAVLFPSVYEGFGFPAVEAMASGTPVIAGRASSIPEVVGDAGLLIEPLDADAWTAAIRALLEDPSRAEGLGRRGLERASAFSWAETAARTLAVYRAVWQARA